MSLSPAPVDTGIVFRKDVVPVANIKLSVDGMHELSCVQTY